jgi:CRP-like cAMP-binding protein
MSDVEVSRAVLLGVLLRLRRELRGKPASTATIANQMGCDPEDVARLLLRLRDRPYGVWHRLMNGSGWKLQ